MKRTSYLFLMALAAVLFTACKPSYKAKGHETENLQNKEIRNTFYGVEFGASKQALTTEFQKYGLVADKKASNENVLDFYYTPEARPFTYLGYQEPFFRACAVFRDGKFSQIEFYNIYMQKYAAEEAFKARQAEYLTRYYEGELRHKNRLPKNILEYNVAKGLNGVNSYVALCETKTLGGKDAYCVEVGFQKR